MRSAKTIALIALLLTSASAQAEWQGRILAVDGHEIVENQAPAQAPVTLQLRESWRLGGDSEDEDEFFGVISQLIEDPAGNVCLLDQVLNVVKIFSPDGAFLRAIGREGEGPGEFRNAQSLALLPDGNLGVGALIPGRMVKLSLDGSPAGIQELPVPEGSGFILLLGAQCEGSDLLVVTSANAFDESKFTTTRKLLRIAPDGEILSEYISDLRAVDLAKPVIEERSWDGFEGRWALGRDGRVFAVETWGEYAVTMWGPDGKKERVIRRELDRRKRSRAERDRLHAIYEPFIRSFPGSTPGIESHDSSIVQIHIRPDGTLWVLNAFGAFDRPAGSLGVFDVFDREGRFLREITLMGQGDPLRDGYRFVGDRLYVMTGFLDAAMNAAGGADDAAEDVDAEPMAVICYELEEVLQTAVVLD